uniref:Pathogenesis-related protein PsemI n=1 Tax=Pseudotsuga menziesii TaxID=3357 RepID=Q9M664_PSEMZ|nr:pathogenesis-related protein PsemI [Pseudotsuga menziesii]
MVSGTSSTEEVCQVEARRLWTAMVKDSHNLLPKVLPEIFASVTCHQGDGGVGTIKQLNFTPANKDFSFVKERVDEIDEGKMVYKYTTIEGGSLGKKLSSASFEVKIVPRKEGGCVASWVCNYETLPGAQLEEAKAKEIKENSIGMLKKIEQYLLSNPNLYC